MTTLRPILFSVIVPVFEQWDLFDQLLEALARQRLDLNAFEIIAVDNGVQASAPTKRWPPNLRIVRCDQPGSYAARNMGASVARGKWLAFTDADCCPSEHWLAALASARLKHGESVLLAGEVRVEAGQNPNIWQIYDVLKGIPQRRYVAKGYAVTANLCVPRAVFRELDGFDAARFSGGDAEFCRRANRNGYQLLFVEGAAVLHPARATWQELATKARRVKGGQLVSGTPLRYKLSAFIPPFPIALRFLSARQYPLSYRTLAIFVQSGLWLVECSEMVRLLLGGKRERR